MVYEDEDICTACKGLKKTKVQHLAGVKVLPEEEMDCFYCGGSGLRRDQVFNWMKDKQGVRLVFKEGHFEMNALIIK